jgi:hypothetical protein
VGFGTEDSAERKSVGNGDSERGEVVEGPAVYLGKLGGDERGGECTSSWDVNEM